MNSIESVLHAIRGEYVDRIPASLHGTDMEYQKGLAQYVGVSSVEDMYRKLGIDLWCTCRGLRYVGPQCFYKGRPVALRETMYDEYNPHPPFADVETVEEVLDYPEPAPDDFADDGLSDELDSHANFAIMGSVNAAMFHNFLYMCGQLDGLCMLKQRPELAHAIIEKITRYWEAYITRFAEVAAGRIQIMENCNDFGTQLSMFISAEDFRTFFKEPLKRLYAIAHANGLYQVQHSCGAVRPLIDDFISMGADVLNPIQVCAIGMELLPLARQYRGRIALFGGIDTQHLLPNGPAERIQEAVRAAVEFFGHDGGYILAGSQGLMKDISYANAVSMLAPALRA